MLSIGITAVLPFSDIVQEAEALKSNGNSLPEIGSKKVCGDRLCVEVGENSQNLQVSATEMVMNQQPTVSLSSYSDLLPSWNSGNSKQKIIEFVDKVIDTSSPAFVLPKDRIATFDNDGTVFWLDGVIFDVSDHKKAEQLAEIHQQQLIQADKMSSLGILVSGVAHEINNPNNFILINSNNIALASRRLTAFLQTYFQQEITANE